MSEQGQNLVELYQRSCERYAQLPLFGTKKEGAWRWTTYGQFRDLVDRVRGGLAALGIGPGDRVAMIADNCVEWAAAAYAVYGLEAAFVPMYQAQRPSEWEFILRDCDARAVFVANDRTFDAVQAMRPRLPGLTHVIGLGRPVADPASFAALLESGAAKPTPARSPAPTVVAGFIYTSGTTGKPKGALLSHGNIVSNIAAVHEIFTLEPADRTLAFLPWAHSFGQTCELHMVMSYGASSAINDDLTRLLPNLAEVKPTVLVAVPRIFNRIYEAVNQQISERPRLLQRIIRTGLRNALRQARGEALGPFERLELAFDDKVVFSKIRDKFGGRLRFVFSGSATLNREVAEFIDALGIPVYEGYGLTETSPIVTSNHPAARRIGSVGRVLPGVRVEIDRSVTSDPSEGEIVVHGPNVMLGYHNRPEETAQALTADGGLRTGDLGRFDADGFLYVTGRIKEQYKLENGKYVMPSPLEETLKLSPYIANVMVHGDGHAFNVALVVPSAAAIAKWAEEQGFALPEDLTRDERVRALVRQELEAHESDFKGYEKPRAFALVLEDFTVENGLLTPTMKLKRREVVARYQATIEELYRTAPAAASTAA